MASLCSPLMECLDFVDPPNYRVRCGYPATNAKDLARHQAVVHPERAAYDEAHSREMIVKLRHALQRMVLPS